MRFDPRFNPLADAVSILTEGCINVFDKHEVSAILEDQNSPITMKYNQKLYDSVINRKHIDFDDIEASRGDIRSYTGYKNMLEILKIISSMDEFKKNVVSDYVNTVQTAISNIESLRDIYQKGFDLKCDFVMLEYNTMVYTCVEAVTTLLYEFVDIVKRPSDNYTFVIKNTKYRANVIYINQLEKFNGINRNMFAEHRKFLLSSIEKSKDNFVGSSMAWGIGTLIGVSLALVPLIRELIYQFYNIKRKVSDSLMYQAKFLELNRSMVEANQTYTPNKKKEILQKQDVIRKKFIMWSEKLRAEDVRSNESTKRELKNSNNSLSISSLKKDIENDELMLL